jgi:hypothetical protein
MATLNDFAALEDVFFPEKAQARKEKERLAHEKAVAECKALIRACDETIAQLEPIRERLYSEYSAIRDKWWDDMIGTGTFQRLYKEKDEAYKAYRDEPRPSKPTASAVGRIGRKKKLDN